MSITQKLKDYLASEGQMIRSAPLSYVAAVAGAFVVIWFAMDWRYGGISAVNLVQHRVVNVFTEHRINSGEIRTMAVAGKLDAVCKTRTQVC